MIVVHAAVQDGQILLWGESPDGEKPSKGRGISARSEKPTNLKRYQFDAGRANITTLLAHVSSGLKADKTRFHELVGWFPTRGESAVPSSPLIADPSGSKAKVALRPWLVTVYGLSGDESVELLCVCADKSVIVPGIVIGEDLAFWCKALRFAGSLVARQRYLPSVDVQADRFLAVWRPIYSGDDSEALTHLAQHMPPVTRAFSKADAAEPPTTPAIEALRRFIDQSLDYLVRSSKWAVASTARRGKSPAFESIHDAWLHALRSQDNRIAGSSAELSGFADQLREWVRPVAVTASSPLRLCFRLEEPQLPETPKRGRPKAASPSWHVRYLLQPRDDLSLLIPVEDAWNPVRTKVPVLQKMGPGLTEYLLTSLGQASAMCPGVAASLKAAQPGGYDLDAKGAHDFLTERALILKQAGFGLLLPAWWTGTGTKLHVSLSAGVKSPRMKAGTGLSLDEIVQFDWEVAIGGEAVTLQELQELARLKAPLVKIRGQWVEISPEQIQAAIDLWSKKASDRVAVKDVIRIALGAGEALHGFEVERVKASGWVGSLLKQLGDSGRIAPLPPDRSFSGTLRPYQMRGLSWLGFLSQWGMGACLADDMGLGKTIQTLALIQRYWHADGKKPVLLVCPTTVVNNWQKEASRFTPDLPVLIHHGVGRSKGAEFKKEVGRHAIVISSYGLLHRDISLLQGLEWSGIVLDEAQNIKNSETKQARSARSLKAGFRIALTGTPVENNVGDLWSIMEFLNPGFLGTQTEFKRDFFVPIQAERDPAAMDRLKRITGPFLLRRLKTDKSIIADLPDKMEMKVFCPLTKEQGSLYAAVVRDAEEALKSSEGIQRKGLVLATLSKLKQVCNHPAHFLGDNSAVPGRSGKLTRLAEMLEEVLESGERALIFTQFAEMGKLLRTHLEETFGREVLFLHGALTKQKRDRMVERFQNAADGPPIFILSLKAGGTGLNLTAANHVFHFDRWWNPAVENQATDRAFRIGQTKNVQVHKFVCAGTLEEKIDDMIEAKKDVAEKVVGTGEGWITEMSNKDLKELWKLRKEAIG